MLACVPFIAIRFSAAIALFARAPSVSVCDTDLGTKLETGAKSAEQIWVRSVEIDGGRERAENHGSEIRDVASRAKARNE